MGEYQSSPELVTEGQVFGWRVRVREINEEIKTLSAERDKLVRLIDMAQMLASEAKLLNEATGQASHRPKFINDELEGLRATDTFPTAVFAIVKRADDGIVYPDLRDAIIRSPLASRFRESEKGFYHAIARLKKNEKIIDYNGYLFTPENLVVFKRKVAAGLKQDKVQEKYRGSPMISLILELVAEHPGLIAKEVIQRLRRTNAEMAERLTDNENSAYNAIARLKKRGQLVGRGKDERELHIGPKAAEEYQRMTEGRSTAHLFDAIEAPNGDAAGASKSGEGATSPADNSQGVRLVS